ncbi:type II secretion system F family protein [Cereibacter sphaeroides]|uniref:type II secretion system F family protein n=1 Tax=Cereibacter sphaeroides TaxID=1063 RepID=UPI001F438C9D|nr:type II secretion system F family protein [Cereibacter sphaeroides]MCE6959708.1 type II secretion system F family protein [Cereibacter sphaeroides]MCE6974431.1 type II secretion system F family protein [Cereibacter sphaeroides]
MPIFKAKVSIGGKTTEVSLAAENREDAERQLKRRGRIVSLKREGFFDLNPGLTPYERFVFLVKLATMVGAKVSMGRALELMGETFTGNIRRVARQMSDKVNNGVNFIQAMESEAKSFPGSIVALVKAGFSAGNASMALREAAEFEQLMQSIRKGSMKDIWTGFGYFAAAAGLTAATMLYFGPMVTGNPMFAKAGVKTDWMEQIGWIFLWLNVGILAIMVFLAFFGTIGRLANPARADWLISKIPFYCDLILAKNNYVTFYKLALLVTAGVRIEESLELVGRDIPRGALRADFDRSLEYIRKGKQWPLGMETLDATDRASLMASSDREDIARTFKLMAEQFRDLYIARIQTLGPMINMLAALFMSLASALMFGLTILPMLQLSTKI